MELFMIYARIGSETFYDTAKRLEEERRKARLEVAQLDQTDDKSAQHDQLEKERGSELTNKQCEG